MNLVSSWGRLNHTPHQVVKLTDPTTARTIIGSMSTPGVAYGMGRSYGDACLNPDGLLWNTTGLDHFIAFDEDSGLLTCEAGVLLRDIQRLTVPRGWMLPVTPGTQMITVGGAIANDVHGKNHHVFGAFGDHVEHIELIRTNGEKISCGPLIRPDWFAATVGGVGLTGVIVTAQIRLRRIAGPWLDTETTPFSSLDTFFSLADNSEADWEHTVAWIDCLSKGGRGLFMRGNPSTATEVPPPRRSPRTMPFQPPISLVNRCSLQSFNLAYYQINRHRAGPAVAHYEPFFYPLDNLLEWNRMYGPRGFFQYQSVVPRETGSDATRSMLEAITHSGEGSFLAVLKTFGNRPATGLLSFPQPGVTLALDFPNRGARTARLFARLDAIVLEAKGRLYLAKDARMSRELFEAGYPRLHEFLKYRDPGISSALSRRLMEY